MGAKLNISKELNRLSIEQWGMDTQIKFTLCSQGRRVF